VTKKGGQKIRLAFQKGTNKVLEAKNLETGSVHSEKEFAADRKRKGAKLRHAFTR
jgi:hypothetical protein